MRRAYLFLASGLLASLLGCAIGSDDGQGRVTLPTEQDPPAANSHLANDYVVMVDTQANVPEILRVVFVLGIPADVEAESAQGAGLFDPLFSAASATFNLATPGEVHGDITASSAFDPDLLSRTIALVNVGCDREVLPSEIVVISAQFFDGSGALIPGVTLVPRLVR